MRLHLLLLLLVPLVIIGCGRPEKDTVVDDLLGEAKLKFAPDKRTVIFKVSGILAESTLTLKGEVHNQALKDQLLRFIRERHSWTIVDSLVALPDTSLQGKVYGVVSASVINMRVKRGHAQEMGTQALLGTPLKVLKKQGGWFLIQTPDEYLGWTEDLVAMMTAEEYAAWQAKRKVIVTADHTSSHAGPGARDLPVSDLVAGCILALKGATASHFAVEYPDGRTAYVRRTDVELLDGWLARAKDTPETIVATAQRFIGVPYLWGGTSAKGLDCSGYAKTVYFLNGVLLPRDAGQQVHVGDSIDTSAEMNLQPGDLLFFGSAATADRPERVTHVGISLGGKRFIHESVHVHVSSLDPADADYAEPLHRRFLRAKRIIGAGEEAGVRRLAQIPYYAGYEH
jgi:cell wall-associated NlpC family hydrolase